MKEKISYSKLAITAMFRTAEMAQKKAAEKNLEIPIWQDGKIVYIESKKS